MLTFYKKCGYFLFCFLCACSGETDDKMAESATNSEKMQIPAISYQMIETEKRIIDETSPLGEWNLFVSYPEIEGLTDDKITAAINNHIVTLANKFRCEASAVTATATGGATRGEHAFSSEVKFLDDKLLSMAYEAMLFCPPMPSPDSSSGSLNLDLTSSKVIALQTEFISQQAENEFHLLIENKIKEQQSSGEECAVKNRINYFYKTKTSVIFVLDADRHSEAACVTDVELTSTELMRFLQPQSLLLR